MCNRTNHRFDRIGNFPIVSSQISDPYNIHRYSAMETIFVNFVLASDLVPMKQSSNSKTTLTVIRTQSIFLG